MHKSITKCCIPEHYRAKIIKLIANSGLSILVCVYYKEFRVSSTVNDLLYKKRITGRRLSGMHLDMSLVILHPLTILLNKLTLKLIMPVNTQHSPKTSFFLCSCVFLFQDIFVCVCCFCDMMISLMVILYTFHYHVLSSLNRFFVSTQSFMISMMKILKCQLMISTVKCIIDSFWHLPFSWIGKNCLLIKISFTLLQH